MPGGVHGKQDPMEDLINKYLGEEDEEDEGEHEHDELKHQIAEQEAALKR